MSERTHYDTLVVGGGPAGLAAALHLGWHRRKVLVIDRVSGPLFFTLEKLWNVPGFEGATGAEIQKKLRAQAEAMGAEVVRGDVVRAAGEVENFRLEGKNGEIWQGRTLLLATGVARYHPAVDGDFRPCFAYAGKGNLYYCPDCEGPELFGKEAVVIAVGSADAAAWMAIGLTRYTARMRLLLPRDRTLSPALAVDLEQRGIGVVRGEIAALVGARRELRALTLDDGSELAAEAFFVSSPARGRSDLASQLGLELAPDGHHVAVASQRGDTSEPGIWVAGDLRPMTQQVAVAMGTGNLAAVMIDQFLRRRDIGPSPER